MGLFDVFKKKENNDKKENDFSLYLKTFCEQCNNVLLDFEQNPPIQKIEMNNGVTLDFSEKSIDIIPEIIDSIKSANEAKAISDAYYDSCITVLGWYLGETLLKNGLKEMGCKWQVSESIPGNEGIKIVYIISPNGWMHFPIDKVMKYALNGKEEDIKGFYKSCFELSK